VSGGDYGVINNLLLRSICNCVNRPLLPELEGAGFNIFNKQVALLGLEKYTDPSVWYK